MKIYEHKYEDLGWICGIDEVGRGPLAGLWSQVRSFCRATVKSCI